MTEKVDKQVNHWSEEKEKKGSLGQMRFLFLCYKYLGPGVIRIILYPVIFFFCLFSGSAGKSSREFLQKVESRKGSGKKIGFREVYRHFYCFSYALIEKLAAWSGDSNSGSLLNMTEDITELTNQLAEGKGAVALCSHLGNMEMLRAFGSLETGIRLPDFQTISIVDFSGTAQFNALLEEVNPKAMVKLIDAKSIDPTVMIYLKECIDKGDLVVIAGDRTSGTNRDRNTVYSFLGEDAYFPQGAFVLACLLGAPVYYMFALRENDCKFNTPYEFYVYKSTLEIEYTRKNRGMMIESLTAEYVQHLEGLSQLHPYQWFNFFNFWENPSLIDK